MEYPCTCQICGPFMAGPESTLCDCQNGHYFCTDCLDIDTNILGLAVAVVEDFISDDPSTERSKMLSKELLRVAVSSDKRYAFDLVEELGGFDFIPSEYCPVCQMTFEGNKLLDNVGYRYLLDKLGISSEDLKEEMGSRFDQYSDFEDYMKAKKLAKLIAAK